MEPNTGSIQPQDTIQAFLKVINEHPHVWDSESIKALSLLDDEIRQLKNESQSVIADAIIVWCKNYPDIRDAVRFSGREIAKIRDSDPASQEGIKTNEYPELRRSIQEKQNKPQTK